MILINLRFTFNKYYLIRKITIKVNVNLVLHKWKLTTSWCKALSITRTTVLSVVISKTINYRPYSAFFVGQSYSILSMMSYRWENFNFLLEKGISLFEIHFGFPFLSRKGRTNEFFMFERMRKYNKTLLQHRTTNKRRRQ